MSDIKDFKFHELRHTAASYLKRNGATKGELVAIFRASIADDDKKYAHYNIGHLATLLQKK